MTIYRNREKPLGFTFYFRPLNPMFEYQCNKTSLGQSLRKYNGTLDNICVCIIRDSAFSVSYMNAGALVDVNEKVCRNVGIFS